MSLNDAIEAGNLDEATRLLEKMKRNGESMKKENDLEG